MVDQGDIIQWIPLKRNSKETENLFHLSQVSFKKIHKSGDIWTLYFVGSTAVIPAVT